ncbi:hypothetical protein AAMO2058_001214300 [Amorphochlora amoebiformis]
MRVMMRPWVVCQRCIFVLLLSSCPVFSLRPEPSHSQLKPSKVNNPEIIRLLEPKHALPTHLPSLVSSPAYLPSNSYIAQVSKADNPGLASYFWNLSHDASNTPESVHLTISPVGKHLAALSMNLFRNLPNPTVLESGKIHKPLEFSLLPLAISTTPWVWSRIDRCQLRKISNQTDSIDKSWGCYFKLPQHRSQPPQTPASERISSLVDTFIQERNTDKHLSSKQDQDLRALNQVQASKYLASQYIIAMCFRHIFTLTSETQSRVEAVQSLLTTWPKSDDKNAVVASVHIRRGDVAGFNCSHKQVFRPCTYMHEQVMRLRGLQEIYGVTHVYVMTENAQEVELARDLAPEFTWMSLAEVRVRVMNRVRVSLDIELRLGL